jgi:hypothetical protein
LKLLLADLIAEFLVLGEKPESSQKFPTKRVWSYLLSIENDIKKIPYEIESLKEEIIGELYRDHIIANKQAYYKEISYAVEIIEYVEKAIPNYKHTSMYFDDENNPGVQISGLMLSMTIGFNDLIRIPEEIKREEKKKAYNDLM